MVKWLPIWWCQLKTQISCQFEGEQNCFLKLLRIIDFRVFVEMAFSPHGGIDQNTVMKGFHLIGPNLSSHAQSCTQISDKRKHCVRHVFSLFMVTIPSGIRNWHSGNCCNYCNCSNGNSLSCGNVPVIGRETIHTLQ